MVSMTTPVTANLATVGNGAKHTNVLLATAIIMVVPADHPTIGHTTSVLAHLLGHHLLNVVPGSPDVYEL